MKFSSKFSFNRIMEDMDAATVYRDYVHNIIDSMADTLLVINTDGSIRMVNQAVVDLLGYTEKQLLHQNIEMIFSGDKTGRWSGLSDLIEKGTIHNREGAYISKEGTKIPILFSGSVMDDGNGAIQGIVCVAKDMREQKRIKEQLERDYHTQRVVSSVLRISLESAPLVKQLEHTLDLIFSIPWLHVPPKGSIFLVEDNDPQKLKLMAHLGLAEQSLTKSLKVPSSNCICIRSILINDIIAIDCHNDCHTDHSHVIPPHGHISIPISSGSRLLGVICLYTKKGYRLEKEEKDVLSLVANTVAGIIERELGDEAIERKNSELEWLKDNLENMVHERTKELETANNELSRLNQVKSNFISLVSHELRTPLTSIKSFVQILLDDLEGIDVESQRKYLSIVNSETDRLGRLINDILDLQKIDSGKMVWKDKKMDIIEITRSSIDFFSCVYNDKGVSLSFSATDEQLLATVDSDKIKQVLANLLSNALKFTEKKGKVNITLERINEENQPDKGIIQVSVSDTGAGIPPEEKEKIFERFHQIDNSQIRQRGGSGLGLSICKEIIEHYHGELWVESTPDKGSRFFFTLPQEPKHRMRMGELLINMGMLTSEQFSEDVTEEGESDQ